MPLKKAPPAPKAPPKTKATPKVVERTRGSPVSTRVKNIASAAIASIVSKASAAKKAPASKKASATKISPATKEPAAKQPSASAKKSTATTSKKRKAEDEDQQPTNKRAKKAPAKKIAPAKKVASTKKGTPAKKTPLKPAAAATTNKKAPTARNIATAKKPVATKRGAKTTAATPTPKNFASFSAKRKASDATEEEPQTKRGKKMANNNTKKAAPAKKPPKKAAAPKKHVAPGKVAASKPKKVGPVINEVPTKLLDIYVFGEGSAGELGLGAMKFQGKKPIDVKRPRLNHLLSAKDVGVVAIAVGGMHCAVLTHDNRILTWGVNDDGALGRQTDAAKMVDMQNDDDEDSDEDSDDEDSGLNPSEAEPRAVDPKHFPEGTKFAKLIACDSATFVATEDGLVYGWGSFRDELGPLGFREDKDIQLTPILIPELKGVIDLAAGTNHILALTNKGKVLAWGSSESNQLARRVVKRTAHGALIPREFGLKGVTTAIGCGDFHSFAVNKDGTVRAWGLNSYGECLISKDGPGDNDIVPAPTIVKKLKGFNITQIAGGAHHGIALTEEGKVLTWGRMDMEEGGILPSEYPEGALFVDEHGRPRMAVEPTEVPNINGKLIASGPEHLFAVNKDGQAYSWGFSANYQTGQGTDEPTKVATLLENSALKGKNIVGVGAGGQFGVLVVEHEDEAEI